MTTLLLLLVLSAFPHMFSAFVNGTTLVFNPICDIHDVSYANQSRTPRGGILPQKASTDWLYASKDDIQKWYEIGLQECESFLSQHNFNKDHGPPFYSKTPVGNKCRGKDLLYTVTNILLWPFGPKNNCPIYSKCWFGVLSCGKPNNQNILQLVKPHQQTYWHDLKRNYKLSDVDDDLLRREPYFTNWSVKGLNLHIRVIGNEIVVPEHKWWTVNSHHDTISTLSSTTSHVLIAQYQLTIPGDDYKAELRHIELYTGAFFHWSKEQLKHGAMYTANIFLGGTEGRCAPWTNCGLTNNCCGCDERSFVQGSPWNIVSKDISYVDTNSKRNKDSTNTVSCPKIRSKKLPICDMHQGSDHPGRWVHSASSSNLIHSTSQVSIEQQQHRQHQQVNYSHSEHCESDVKSRIFPVHQPRSPRKRSPAATFNQRMVESSPTFSPSTNSNVGWNATNRSASWHDASGDPCFINTYPNKEELGQSSWFYAPYSCKYHFYERHEIRQCFQTKNISHIHFQGDSMSRDLFEFVAEYLGIPPTSTESLKDLTNKKKINQFQYQSSDLIISEGYSWHFDKNITMLAQTPPFPDVIIINHALSHNYGAPLHLFEKSIQDNALQYYTQDYPKYMSKLHPEHKVKYFIFQNGRALLGRRNTNWNADLFRSSSDVIKNLFDQYYYINNKKDVHKSSQLSPRFLELNEYLLTAGRFDSYNVNFDGLHFKGTQKQMEAVILINMLCNDWLISSSTR